jgi:hypothetical protein
VIYQWKNGSKPHGGVPAQVVGERLQTLRDRGVRLNAQIVKEDARPPESPLHKAVFWKSPNEAAEAWYDDQAGYLLRSVVISSSTDPNETMRAFVVVNDVGEDAYEAIATVMEDPDLRAQVLARALREFKAWQTRYHDFAELAKVFAAASKVKVPA